MMGTMPEGEDMLAFKALVESFQVMHTSLAVLNQSFDALEAGAEEKHYDLKNILAAFIRDGNRHDKAFQEAYPHLLHAINVSKNFIGTGLPRELLGDG